MGSIKKQPRRNGQIPSLGKKRALAVAVASVLSVGPALAQDEAVGEEYEEELVVKGVRRNLMNAQDIKYNADTVIESITADDLGSFPDKSIAEALQRVAGITVNRFAATADTAHFSAEPSGVIVRGLTLVRTEFNGRDSFSANSSRGLSWTDVSPDLMARVDTYKNQMAELIEGGIAGTVDMRTRLPFDQEGTLVQGSVSANYNDLAEETTPEVSGVFSTRWDTGIGEFGFMGNLAYSEVNTRSDGIQLARMARYQNVYGPDTFNYIPTGVAFRDNLYERERLGTSLALQWADPTETLLFTTQYNRSQYDNAWEEYVVTAQTPGDDAQIGFGQDVNFVVDGNVGTNNINGYNQDTVAPMPAVNNPAGLPSQFIPGQFTFDSRGLFQTGVMTRGTGWWGTGAAEAASIAQNANGDPMVVPCYGNSDNGWNVGADPCNTGANAGNAFLRGIDTSTATRSNNNTNITEDLSFNFKWELSDTVRSNFDLQLVESEVENYDIEVAFATFSNTAVDLSGEHPSVVLLDPVNVNRSEGGLSNPNNYYIRSIMDHVEDSEGEEVAFKMDFEFDLGNDWLESLKVGARFADREQTVRWSGYNWQNVANTWSGGQAPYWNLDRHDPANGAGAEPGFTGYPEDIYVQRSFRSDFFDGNNLTPNNFLFANMDMLQDQRLWASTMGAQALGFLPAADPTQGAGGWDPICSNFGDRAAEIPGTCFTPAEISDVSEESQALYVQLNFGGADAALFGVPFSGNIGVRYVETDIASSGGIAFPGLSEQDSECDSTDDGNPMTPDPPVPFTVGCYLSEADRDFMNGAEALNTVTAEHENWLPSFNIKFELTDELLARFAASRAMSRPDIGNLRNYVGTSYQLPSVNNVNDPLWIKDSMGTIIGASVNLTANAHNPFMKPTIADQFDLSFEYYFGNPGSVTLAMFKKNFDDYIQNGNYDRVLTNNGVTREVEITGPLNGEGASLQGYELTYKSFFDFLPAPFDGFGMEMSYTKVDNQGITNPNLKNTGTGTVLTDQAPNQIVVDGLESLSEDSYTMILMYENDSIATRLAYSWRSEHLVTVVDCCVAYPVWNDDSGQLDGSVRWYVAENSELGITVSNITNVETRTRQQVSDADDGGTLFPSGYFQNDRRLTLGYTFRY